MKKKKTLMDTGGHRCCFSKILLYRGKYKINKSQAKKCTNRQGRTSCSQLLPEPVNFRKRCRIPPQKKKKKAVGYVPIQSKPPIFTSATFTNSFGGWSGSRNHKAQLSVRRAPAFTAVIGEMLDITFLRVTVVLTYPQVNAPGRVPQIHLYGSRGNAVHHSAVTRSQSIYLKAVAETRRR